MWMRRKLYSPRGGNPEIRAPLIAILKLVINIPDDACGSEIGPKCRFLLYNER